MNLEELGLSMPNQIGIHIHSIRYFKICLYFPLFQELHKFPLIKLYLLAFPQFQQIWELYGILHFQLFAFNAWFKDERHASPKTFGIFVCHRQIHVNYR